MAHKKKRKVNTHCNKHGHTLRFWKYIGDPDESLPNDHVDYNPKTAIFKCCNCSHQEVRKVQINWKQPPVTGNELFTNGFVFFNRDSN